jgi:hypothetical protein
VTIGESKMSEDFGADQFMEMIKRKIRTWEHSVDDILKTRELMYILEAKIKKMYDKLDGGCCFFGGNSLSIGQVAVVNNALVQEVGSKIYPLLQAKNYFEAVKIVENIDVDELINLARRAMQNSTQAVQHAATISLMSGRD